MGKVLKADASADYAYVEHDLGADEPEVWVTFRTLFDAAALAEFVGSASGYFAKLLDPTHGAITDYVSLSSSGWESQSGQSALIPDADTWVLVEVHHVNGGTCELYIDGTLVVSDADFSGLDTRFGRFGQSNGDLQPEDIVYIDDVKVGTTRGASDIFADDFEDGTTDAWTTVYGDVSVVDDPFPSPSVTVQAVRILVAFTDDTLTEDPDFTDLAAL